MNIQNSLELREFHSLIPARWPQATRDPNYNEVFDFFNTH